VRHKRSAKLLRRDYDHRRRLKAAGKGVSELAALLNGVARRKAREAAGEKGGHA
jgi:hypothetical protein